MLQYWNVTYKIHPLNADPLYSKWLTRFGEFWDSKLCTYCATFYSTISNILPNIQESFEWKDKLMNSGLLEPNDLEIPFLCCAIFCNHWKLKLVLWGNMAPFSKLFHAMVERDFDYITEAIKSDRNRHSGPKPYIGLAFNLRINYYTRRDYVNIDIVYDFEKAQKLPKWQDW